MLSIIPTNLFFHEILHGLFVIPGSIYIYYKTKSLKLVILAICITYFIDLDHLIDYFFYYGATFNLSDFLQGNQFVSDNAIIAFHGWEYSIVLYWALRFKNLKWVFLSILAGYLPHLLLDTISTGKIGLYSIFYRLFLYLI